MPNRRALFVLAAMLLVARSATAASVVTGVSAGGPVIGNSNQTGTVTVSVSCDPGVSSVGVYVWGPDGGLGGQIWFYDAVWTAPCSTYQATFFAQYEVPAPTAYQVRACVVGWNGYCAHEPVIGTVTVNPPQYTVTPLTTSVRVSRSPGPRTFRYPTNVVYGIGEPACRNTATVFGSLVLSAASLPASGSVPIYHCGVTWSFGGGEQIGFVVAQVQRPAPPPPALQLRAGVVVAGEPIETKTAGSAPVNAVFPLGAVFFIQIQKPDATPVPATFTLAGQTVSPVPAEATLFPDITVMAFDAAEVADTKVFRGVHLGTAVLTVKPSDSSLPVLTINLTVNEPASLGGPPNEFFDALAIDFGHRRGIPPQFLKAQMQRESNFDPEAYRYEPLKMDMAWPGGAPASFRYDKPYSQYALATTDGLARGEYLLDADVARRSDYVIPGKDGKLRAIADTDEFVSALTIFNANDRRVHWTRWNANRAAAVAKNPSLLDFTAETPLAASYGLLQILYTTAIAPMGWKGFAVPGVKGNQHPSYLFDTDAAVANDAGSVAIGSGYLRRIFGLANRTLSRPVPAFRFAAEMDEAFARAFTAYQVPGRLGKLKPGETLTSSEYGRDVVYTRAQTFLPVRKSGIFQ